MALSLSNFDSVLKDYYGKALVALLNNKTRTLKYFDKNGDAGLRSADGRQVVYPIHYQRNPAVGAVLENGTLPSAQNQGTASVKIPYKYNYLRVQLSAQTIKQSMTSKGAFKKAMELEMKNGTDDLARERNRQLWGYGVGILAYVSGQQATSVNLTLRAPGGVALPPGVTGGAARFLLVNQYVAIVRNATPINATNANIQAAQLQVSSVDSTGNIVTFTGATGITANDGDMIVNASSNVSNECSVNAEPMGLLGIVDNNTYLSTLFNISRTSVPKYNATVINVGGSLTLDVLQRAFDLADEKGGQADKMVMFAHHSVRREYLNLLNPIRRFTGEQVNKPDGGWKGQAISSDITFSDRPIMVERMCPLGMLFGIDPTYNVRYVVTEGEWADDDGTILQRVTNQDAYEARYRVFDNFHNDKPASCFRLDNIQSTFDYTPVE